MSYFFIENIMDHYKNPRNMKIINEASSVFGDSNPTCGDTVKIFIKVNENKIEDIGFQGHGCALSMASSSLLTEMVKGSEMQDALKITESDLMRELGIKELGPNRIKCIALSVKTLKMAIIQYLSKVNHAGGGT
ncbi:MAG: SUF system NifU family Fe-S cluster assembly protein [Conexivisphaerales archaeon]